MVAAGMPATPMVYANPYRAFVAGFVRALREGADLSVAGLKPPPPPARAAALPPVLLFSPHPDDECLTGGLPLRLRRELGMAVVNVPVTLGSNPERREVRWRELANACAWLGFAVQAAIDGGLPSINPAARQEQPAAWRQATAAIAALIRAHRPAVVFMPHRDDRHPTHVGTHWLVTDALADLEEPFLPPWIVETEYWGQLADPNLMVGSAAGDVADLVAALSCHRGEVARNAYHLALPAGMIDAVRRGAELVRGHGAEAPVCRFATLYRVSQRTESGIAPVETRRIVAAETSLRGIFEF